VSARSVSYQHSRLRAELVKITTQTRSSTMAPTCLGVSADILSARCIYLRAALGTIICTTSTATTERKRSDTPEKCRSERKKRAEIRSTKVENLRWGMGSSTNSLQLFFVLLPNKRTWNVLAVRSDHVLVCRCRPSQHTAGLASSSSLITSAGARTWCDVSACSSPHE